MLTAGALRSPGRLKRRGGGVEVEGPCSSRIEVRKSRTAFRSDASISGGTRLGAGMVLDMDINVIFTEKGLRTRL